MATPLQSHAHAPSAPSGEVEWERTFDAVPDLIAIMDPNHRIVRVNRAMAERLHRRKDDCAGRLCYEVVHGAQAPPPECPHTRCLLDGRIHATDVQEPRLNGYFTVSAAPIRDGAGRVTGSVHVAHEITAQRRTEQVLRELNATLEERIVERTRLLREQQERLFQAGKMAALGTLVAGVAHEINNPTNFITLNGPILRDIWTNVEPLLDRHFEEQGDFQVGSFRYSHVRRHARELFQGLIDGAHRIRRIIQDLKDFSRPDTSQLSESVDLNTVVADAAGLLTSLIDKRTNHFCVTVERNLPIIRGSNQKLEQVVLNLMQNALESLENRARSVTVSTAHDPASGEIVLVVRDEGCGMTPDVLDHILDPFFTTKRAAGGTGLGLPISAQIARIHGGRLIFASQPGQGTTATLRLPIVRPTPPDTGYPDP